jgi:hypothetical protein
MTADYSLPTSYAIHVEVTVPSELSMTRTGLLLARYCRLKSSGRGTSSAYSVDGGRYRRYERICLPIPLVFRIFLYSHYGNRSPKIPRLEKTTGLLRRRQDGQRRLGKRKDARRILGTAGSADDLEGQSTMPTSFNMILRGNHRYPKHESGASQIEELYHAAREATADVDAALLAQADPEMRSELESLLSQENGEFFDRAAIRNTPHLVENMKVASVAVGPAWVHTVSREAR